MPNLSDPESDLRGSCFLWVDLTREASTAMVDALLEGAFDVARVREPMQISGAVQTFAPLFLCFEFDEPDALGIEALTHTRRMHPSLPVLMITGHHSEALAIWALRIGIWDLLVKPFSIGEFSQRIAALVDLTRRCGPGPVRKPLFSPHGTEALSALNGPNRQGRTYPAIAHVAAHFDRRIALDHVAALCRLSPSQFCRVFRQEQCVSFGQYLLRYRIGRACEQLVHSDALAKDVAYSVGFNDLSYFTRAFKRQVGVCPSEYRAAAGLSNE
jgi:AraC-like DNA-binding protein/CheY-like chemotaxis protein